MLRIAMGILSTTTVNIGDQPTPSNRPSHCKPHAMEWSSSSTQDSFRWMARTRSCLGAARSLSCSQQFDLCCAERQDLNCKDGSLDRSFCFVAEMSCDAARSCSAFAAAALSFKRFSPVSVPRQNASCGSKAHVRKSCSPAALTHLCSSLLWPCNA